MVTRRGIPCRVTFVFGRELKSAGFAGGAAPRSRVEPEPLQFGNLGSVSEIELTVPFHDIGFRKYLGSSNRERELRPFGIAVSIPRDLSAARRSWELRGDLAAFFYAQFSNSRRLSILSRFRGNLR